MKNNRTVSKFQRCFFVMFLFVFSVFFAAPIYAQNEQFAENNKAKLNNKIPKHLPIKIEIDDAETDNLLDTLKVKVTNTGNKPIYFLLFDLVPLDVISPEGLPYSFRLTYGRFFLYSNKEMAKPEDDPLMPGESHTLGYDKSLLARWEEMRESKNLPKPKNFDLNFRKLSFGDGTGFWLDTGLPFPRKAKKDQNGNKPVTMTNSLSLPLTIDRALNTCKSGNSLGVAAFLFTASKWTTFGFLFNNTFDVFTTKANAAPLDCNCRLGCSWYDDSIWVSCCNFGEPNDYIPGAQQASCDNPGECGTLRNYAQPFMCLNGSSCKSSYVVACQTGGGSGCGSCRGDSTLACRTESTNEAEKSSEDEIDNPDPSCCSDSERLSCIQGGGIWDSASCSCISPIVIDIAGNGFNLTGANNGVLFDITNDGVKERLAWTRANSDDVWLALDRNANGRIDNGGELFGSSTFQPYPAEGETKNGFRALAVYDKPAQGGNNNNQIDERDAVFAQLKLWRDNNHNGISESNELQHLANSDIRVLELNYHESRRQDEHGNWFRFRARVRDAQGAQVGRWAWDVFVQVAR